MVQEYTCTLCGYSTREFDDLKDHMKLTHDRLVGGPKREENETGSTPKDENEIGSAPKEREEEIEKPSTDETDDVHPGKELIGTLLDNIPKDMISKIETSGLLRCIFCERSFGDPGELTEHITDQHREEIDNITEGSGPMPMPQNIDAILGAGAGWRKPE